jgi:DNA invertase Pin-like site-specific DNA recombinase
LQHVAAIVVTSDAVRIGKYSYRRNSPTRTLPARSAYRWAGTPAYAPTQGEGEGEGSVRKITNDRSKAPKAAQEQGRVHAQSYGPSTVFYDDSGELEVVVVEDLSRLSRDIEHSASIRKRFAFSGVRLIGIADCIDTLGNGGDLLHGVKSILSEQYLKDLGDKMSRGLRDRAQIGRVTGALPYGYTSATAPDGQGKVPVIVAAQSTVVQRIFRMRAAGRSYRDIANSLNDERIEPPRGRQKDSRKRRDGWAMSGVRSMHQNSKYAGRWTFGARSWKKGPTTGKRVARASRRSHVDICPRGQTSIRMPPLLGE